VCVGLVKNNIIQEKRAYGGRKGTMRERGREGDQFSVPINWVLEWNLDYLD
jgi:hypothetical protein